MATENRTPWWLAGAALRSTMLTTSTTRERGSDAWMGDEDVAEVRPGTGRQGQVDFATFTLPWGRRHALVLLLSHSRLLWLCFYRRQTMAVLTDGLERAFARFGGVPKELLFDQMRAVVLSDQRVGGGELVLNAEFLRFAAHWGFHPRAGRPYRAQTKGKVERPIRYIRDSFFYGRAFANDEDLNEQASRWLEGPANVRRHGTTGERPVDRFERDGVLAQVDFTFQPSIKREQIESLHELGFLDRAENVILLGPPGVGKTHLAISLAIAAAEAGRRVYYGTLAGLIDSLMEARAAGELSRRQRVLTHPALRVVDEIGYLPVSQDGAVLFFQLINARHERASTVLTSNKGFEEWGHVLGDEIMAAALIDRLLHHCPIVNIRGTATGCGSISTGCGLRRNSSVRESQRDRRLRSFAARFGQDSGRSAPCVQPKTPDGHQRENVRSARDVSPRSVQFSVAIDRPP